MPTTPKLRDWLNEPANRTECRDDIDREGGLCSSLKENRLAPPD